MHLRSSQWSGEPSAESAERCAHACALVHPHKTATALQEAGNAVGSPSRRCIDHSVPSLNKFTALCATGRRCPRSGRASALTGLASPPRRQRRAQAASSTCGGSEPAPTKDEDFEDEARAIAAGKRTPYGYVRPAKCR